MLRSRGPDDDHRPDHFRKPVARTGFRRVLPSRQPVTSRAMVDATYTFTTALVRGLALSGVRHACITPGSRSTPITLPLADEPQITDWSHHDERSSAFFALGIGVATGMPAVIITTSGTAAAEPHPAVLEARNGRVPLIVITADRPADLRDVGAPQAIDQTKLFGDAVKWFHDIEPPDPQRSGPGYPGSLAARLVANAVEGPPGPVHLNLRLREPLLPDGNIEPPAAPPLVGRYRAPADVAAARDLAAGLSGKRALLVAGPQTDPDLPAAATRIAAAGGFPILADPLSGIRHGEHDLDLAVAGGDLLASAGFLDDHPPEVILRIGAIPTSKPVGNWLAAHPQVPQILLDEGDWRDPPATSARIVRSDPPRTLDAAVAHLTDPAPEGWAATWVGADRTVREVLDDALEAEAFPTEPGVVRTVTEAIPGGSTLWVASSMPVRDLDLVVPVTERDIHFRANRGANGIDGFISTALGAAAAGDRLTYALAGDLSVVHDLGALVTAGRLDVDLTIVAIDNNGGGIFHLLPQAGATPHFEKHFGTPHGVDLVAVAAAIGVPARYIESQADLDAAVAIEPDGPQLLVVETDRDRNAVVHRKIRQAVAAALADS